MKSVIINEKDNVGVSLEGSESIPAGHKFALKDIAAGEYIIKYGEIIGKATQNIKKGEWVHTHNVKSHLDEKNAAYQYEYKANTLSKTARTFRGYKRKNGKAGIRNEIYIIPTVGCVNNVCRRLEKAAQKYVSGSIDGIFALTHQFGCSQLGEDNVNIRKLLCGIAENPNASYVLFVGLGCENNGLNGIKEQLKDCDNIAYYNCQDVEDEHAYGLEILREFAGKAKELQREETDFSKLCVGLKCGGSDGYSGLTANPLVGRITDRVVACGGSAILTEVPEMFGAEQLLMNKCKNLEVFEKYKAMIENFKDYYTKNGFPVYENPSPGNKKGGITTLEEKSLGCVEKAGSTQITDVLSYGERVKEQGVSALNAPGNDLIAATALAASGCQIVLFTTGRGTPFSTFVPTMKIATNNRISAFKNNWIDFNAYDMDEEGLFGLLEKALNGEYKCKSEDIREIAFYKTGVTL
ncbi:MAG: altronate dehydratase family protein [Candidatus Borkfalkiaceae bacterium]|nr:altronate dehydratase family protein [Clostridia bacterium]MDY6224108.1 altronate dehydratase family protein [Christensenellaceae bacterium]